MNSFHALSVEDVLARLNSGRNGLSTAEAEARLAKYGRNELPKEKPPSSLSVFLKQFRSTLTYILFAATAISAYVGEYNDALGIIIAVLIDAVFGFVQERKAESAVARLKELVVQEATVVRDGSLHRLPSWALVPGDVLVIREGDRLSADARLIDSRDLRADESSLTGESLPVHKSAEPVRPEAPLDEQGDMVRAGTSIVAGQGRAVVVETGSRTALGGIAVSLAAITRPRTPFETRIDRLGRQLGMLSVALAATVLVLGLLRGFGLGDMFFFTVALAVSVIPEGLPAVLAVVMAIGVQRMARRNAIVRRISAVETLGVADVICTDKTGTLTENKMTVREVAVAGQDIAVTGEGWEPAGEFRSGGRLIRPAELPELSLLLRASAFCVEADITRHEGRAGIAGDPTEGALVVLAAKAGLDRGGLSSEMRKIDDLPFSSERKYQAALVETTRPDGSRARQFFAIGAYEVIAAACSETMANGRVLSLDADQRRRFDEANSRLAGRALRVLALAVRDMPEDRRSVTDDDVAGMTLLGIVGMIDPPRPGVADAVARCRRAGIRVIMITCDQKATALAIGREIGLVDEGSAVYTESDIAGLPESEFLKTLRRAAVFARVTPLTKLRVIEGLERLGRTVAMTGDGVNDAPALKRAAIGVSMGPSGTDVSREVADMVLADDNFVSIVSAVEEGRVVFRNVKQTTAYLFTTNLAEAFTILTAILIGMPLPLLPAQILWMNLVTDGLPDIALATEPVGEGALLEPPRRRDAPFITKGILLQALVVSVLMCAGTLGLFAWAGRGGDLTFARSVAFTSMAVFQLWNVFNMRSPTQSLFRLGLFSNPFVLAAVLVSAGFQCLVLYLPFLSATFRVEPLGPGIWAMILLISASVFAAGEGYKLLSRRGWIPKKWL